PVEPEVLGGEEPPGRPAANLTLSLYPGGTRAVLLRLLAVFALFAVVRNNLATADCLRRLCVVALVNGALLALFGLVQVFTAPRQVVYGPTPTEGNVSAPFICRTHFPFYVNLCVGLGGGLLLSTRSIRGGGRLAGGEDVLPRVRNLLNEPQTLWIGAG